ncbi:cytochrome d ubiquinol oxidase subunit II [Verrucomicrobium sp. 3C]|uniref:cytochrome d ubiquinol oxidase subunit II n=1 Tax=Verrucomicrobium sp. 3C TaxID=1134055 RepID=UPI000370A178|nr:cytochrome d ubiquinol oxidase subunit II [Verrucomicrobium sp. 3C]
METIWFVLLVILLGGFVVLDGFDFGAGILLPWISKDDRERRTLIESIGPVWDGNEVWLVAGGGLFFFAFPKAYASALSGFYLAVMIFLWVLILRGISVEIRSQLPSILWRNFWDGLFFLSSLLAAAILGGLLGNLVSGVPIDSSGNFFLPLWTYFLPGRHHGVLDMATLLFSLLAIISLAAHGASYLIWKTDRALQEGAKRAFRRLFILEAIFVLLTLLVVVLLQPPLLRRYWEAPWALLFPGLALLSWAAKRIAFQKGKEWLCFVSSSVFLLASLVSTAFGLYPNLLISSLDPSSSLTIANSGAAPKALSAGLGWFAVGFALIVLYTIMVYRSFWGKIRGGAHGY